MPRKPGSVMDLYVSECEAVHAAFDLLRIPRHGNGELLSLSQRANLVTQKYAHLTAATSEHAWRDVLG